MMNMRLVLFTLVSMTVMSGSVWAEDRRSVEALLPGCRFQASSPAPVQDSEWTQALMCRDADAGQENKSRNKFLEMLIPNEGNVREHPFQKKH